MKQFIFLTVIIVLSLESLTAQPQTDSGGAMNKKFTDAMEFNLKILDTASTGSTYMMLSNNFERIGNAEQKQWQPFYFAAFCFSSMAAGSPDKSKIDPLTDKAISILDKGDALSPNNSEISALRGMILYLRVQADPISRWQTMGKEAAEQLEKAKQQNPANPRPWLIEARAKLYTPEALGGGAKAAKPIAQLCVEKYRHFQPENNIAPNWGKPQAEKLLQSLDAQ